MVFYIILLFPFLGNANQCRDLFEYDKTIEAFYGTGKHSIYWDHTLKRHAMPLNGTKGRLAKEDRVIIPFAEGQIFELFHEVGQNDLYRTYIAKHNMGRIVVKKYNYEKDAKSQEFAIISEKLQKNEIKVVLKLAEFKHDYQWIVVEILEPGFTLRELSELRAKGKIPSEKWKEALNKWEMLQERIDVLSRTEKDLEDVKLTDESAKYHNGEWTLIKFN